MEATSNKQYISIREFKEAGESMVLASHARLTTTKKRGGYFKIYCFQFHSIFKEKNTSLPQHWACSVWRKSPMWDHAYVSPTKPSAKEFSWSFTPILLPPHEW